MSHFVTDRRTGAMDRVPITDPVDWNAYLHVTTPPTSGLFWAVVEDASGEVSAQELAYDQLASYWLKGDHWSRQDGEPGTFSADEIKGWTHDAEDAEEAARLLSTFDEATRPAPDSNLSPGMNNNISS